MGPTSPPQDGTRPQAADPSEGSDTGSRRWRLRAPGPDSTIGDVRPLLTVLGMPTLGLAFALTILTTYGPVLLLRLAHSTTKVGLLIGGEGAFALLVPLIVGGLSDRLPPSALGRRVPFVATGAPVVALSIALLPFGPSYLLAGAAVLAFFVGYYLYYPPYRALYADLLPRRLYARAQGSQALARGAGLGTALLAGGLLLGAWRPLPFIIAAVVVGLTTVALAPVLRLHRSAADSTGGEEASSVHRLLRDPRLRAFAAANALWEFSFAGLKSFIVLYLVRGLGRSPAVASGVIAVVAVAYVAGAPLAGRLADRHGLVRTMQAAGLVFGIGLTLGVLAHSLFPAVVFLPFVALAGAVLLTLPPALAFTVAPDGGQGAASGLLDFSRGVGLVLGPLAIGAAVAAFADLLPATHGYAAMWPVIGIPVLLALPVLRWCDPARGR